MDITQAVNVGDKTIDYSNKEKSILFEYALKEIRGQLIVDIETKTHGLEFWQRHTGTEVARLIRELDLFKDVFVNCLIFAHYAGWNGNAPVSNQASPTRQK